MKIPLIYGFLMALVGALANYALFFAGYHDSPEKLKVAQWISGGVGLVATVVLMALAVRARRTEYPVDRNWSYGSAFGTAFLAAFVGVLIGTVLTYLYMAMINPQFSEVMYQMKIADMEKSGANQAQIDGAASMMRKFLSPVAVAVFSVVGGAVWAVIIALIVAIFFRKRDLPLESVETTPPPLA